MDFTDVTQITSRGRRVRRWLAGAGAPPSLQAQIVLMISALLLGAVITSLLFVGIWRHTAADGARAHAAQAADHRELAAVRRRLTLSDVERARAEAALAGARHRQAAAVAALAGLRRANRATGAGLDRDLTAVSTTAGALSHTTARLRSELAALRAYLMSSLSADQGGGFLDAQLRYLAASTESANAAASSLARQTAAAQLSVAKLRRPTP